MYPKVVGKLSAWKIVPCGNGRRTKFPVPFFDVWCWSTYLNSKLLHYSSGSHDFLRSRTNHSAPFLRISIVSYILSTSFRTPALLNIALLFTSSQQCSPICILRIFYIRPSWRQPQPLTAQQASKAFRSWVRWKRGIYASCDRPSDFGQNHLLCCFGNWIAHSEWSFVFKLRLQNVQHTGYCFSLIPWES
jgi:hypothetical protein